MQMKKLLLACLLAAGSCSAVAETINFDAFPVGGVPPGWQTGTSGRKDKAVSTSVRLGQWHMLRVDYEGKHIRVAMDGKTLIEVDDEHVPGPGAVGLWTRFDSNTMFDDFTFTGT